jgi:hypothetical protein
MTRLADSISQARLLVLVTARPDFAAPWLTRPQATVLTLNRLSRAECARLVAHVAAAHGLQAETVAAIVAKTQYQRAEQAQSRAIRGRVRSERHRHRYPAGTQRARSRTARPFLGQSPAALEGRRRARGPAHDSGSMWFATPSSQGTCTLYSLPVSRRTPIVHRRNRPRIAIDTIVPSAGIAATMNISRACQPCASSTPPRSGPAIAPTRPEPSAQPAPVERIIGG